MSAIEMRDDILKWAEQVDETFLSAVHAMMGTYVKEQREEEVIGYRVGSGEPVLASEADDEFEAIVEDVRQGNYMTIEDMIKQRSQRW